MCATWAEKERGAHSTQVKRRCTQHPQLHSSLPGPLIDIERKPHGTLLPPSLATTSSAEDFHAHEEGEPRCQAPATSHRQAHRIAKHAEAHQKSMAHAASCVGHVSRSSPARFQESQHLRVVWAKHDTCEHRGHAGKGKRCLGCEACQTQARESRVLDQHQGSPEDVDWTQSDSGTPQSQLQADGLAHQIDCRCYTTVITQLRWESRGGKHAQRSEATSRIIGTFFDALLQTCRPWTSSKGRTNSTAGRMMLCRAARLAMDSKTTCASACGGGSPDAGSKLLQGPCR